jgi:hypothetical protein
LKEAKALGVKSVKVIHGTGVLKRVVEEFLEGSGLVVFRREGYPREGGGGRLGGLFGKAMKPKLRRLEVIPLKGGFFLKDPLGISKGVFVSPPALSLCLLMDGTKDLADLKAEYFRLTGYLLKGRGAQAIFRYLRWCTSIGEREFPFRPEGPKKSFTFKGGKGNVPCG